MDLEGGGAEIPQQEFVGGSFPLWNYKYLQKITSLSRFSPIDVVQGHGGRRCETERKADIEIHGYHQNI